MPSIDSVNKTYAVCSVPGGVLGAKDAGVSETDQALALYSFYAIVRVPGVGVNYQVCQMVPSTMKKNEAEKGFAMINRVKWEAVTEKVAFKGEEA